MSYSDTIFLIKNPDTTKQFKRLLSLDYDQISIWYKGVHFFLLKAESHFYLPIEEHEHGKSFFLHTLRSKDKGKGHTSKILKKLTTFFKENGIVCYLDACPFTEDEGRLEFESLVDFYKRCGFVINGDVRWGEGYSSVRMKLI